jgi:hypothetical protein
MLKREAKYFDQDVEGVAAWDSFPGLSLIIWPNLFF